MNYIQNKFLEISSVALGAELMSIKSKKSGREFLWQGDKSVWSRRSPLLFPIVGRAMGDRLKIDGQNYPINMHGYARECTFTVSSKSENYIEYLLTCTDESLKAFPYKYKLYVTYTLKDNALEITYRVFNTDKKTIYFSLGAHPGFNCQIGDYLEFEKAETLDIYVMNNEHYISKHIPYLNNEKIIKLEEHTFDNDALIFKNTKSKYITLKTSSYSIKLNYDNAPYLGIWAKPNAPYVCIEPWFGIDDTEGTDYEFCDKPSTIKLDENETFEYKIQIEFVE